MKEIQLTHGKVAIVDDEDFERCNQHRWSYCGWRKFAYRTERRADGKRATILLHREIAGPKPWERVGQVNGDKLDCRKCNVEILIPTQPLPKNWRELDEEKS